MKCYIQRLFLFLNGLGTTSFDWFWMALTSIFANVVVYFSCLTYLWFTKGTRETLLILLVGLLLIGATDQSTNFFKETVERLRPCYEPSLEG